MKLKQRDYLILRVLRLAPFERRPRGWRFGTKRIPDSAVDRLILAGYAVKDGDCVRAV